MTQPIVGIDIAKESFDVCLVIEGKNRQAQFENTTSGFKKLSHWIVKYTPMKVHACLEATGQYGEALAEYLLKRES